MVGGTSLITTVLGLLGVPVLSGALAAGVTNDSVLLDGEGLAPVKPTTDTSYLRQGEWKSGGVKPGGWAQPGASACTVWVRQGC